MVQKVYDRLSPNSGEGKRYFGVTSLSDVEGAPKRFENAAALAAAVDFEPVMFRPGQTVYLHDARRVYTIGSVDPLIYAPAPEDERLEQHINYVLPELTRIGESSLSGIVATKYALEMAGAGGDQSFGGWLEDGGKFFSEAGIFLKEIDFDGPVDRPMVFGDLAGNDFLSVNQSGDPVYSFDTLSGFYFQQVLVDVNGDETVFQSIDFALNWSVGDLQISLPVLAGLSRGDSFNADGIPMGPAVWMERARQWRWRRAKLKSNTPNEIVRIGMWGDSYFDGSTVTPEVSKRLHGLFGTAGGGYTGTVTDAVSTDECRWTSFTGGWATVRCNGTTPEVAAAFPSLSYRHSSTPGDVATLYALRLDAATLVYKGSGASEQIRYRYNGEAWNAMTLDGTGTQFKAMVTPPAGVTVTTEIEVVSGDVSIGGVICERNGTSSAGGGVILHEFAASGSRISDLLFQDPVEMAAAIAPFNIHVHTIGYAVNDRARYTPEEFKAHLIAWIAFLRTVTPEADIILIPPPANLRDLTLGYARPMCLYQRVVLQVARDYDCAVINMQAAFPPPEKLEDMGLFLSTDIDHPASPAGFMTYSETILQSLLYT